MNEQEHRSSEEESPGTRARRAGEPPVAGRISPAEKSEPSGVPLQEQRHNADPNAPQNEVTPPGATQMPESESGGVPATSLREGPDLGTDEARKRAQIRYSSPPSDAGRGSSRQTNEPALPSGSVEEPGGGAEE